MKYPISDSVKLLYSRLTDLLSYRPDLRLVETLALEISEQGKEASTLTDAEILTRFSVIEHWFSN